MKRKAPQALDSESPTKVSKETTEASADRNSTNESASPITNSSKDAETNKESTPTSARSSSSRQRKAPAWLSSYVTDNSTSKESPKSSATSENSPSVTSSVKKKAPKIPQQQQVKKETDGKTKPDDEPPSLRRGSTVKLEDSPPHSVKNKKSLNMLQHTPSLVKKDTEILSSPTSDSGDSLAESKPYIQVLGKSPGHLNNSSSSMPSQSPNSSQMLGKRSTRISSKQHITKPKSSIFMHDVDADELSCCNVVEVCDTKRVPVAFNTEAAAAYKSADKGEPSTDEQQKSTQALEKPKMLEIVFCVSTSGAMKDYLAVLQEKMRDLVWQLQSLIPDLRIGVLAHTQGGIHDDKPGSGSSAIDHNYIRTGGHSGTKWLDLGATFAQICAFVDSLEPEATVYPDYVQDNLEMALWKLQRCMSWSSCSYRTVVMIGQGRPNRTSFYLQREHWRGWIRSALEIGAKAEIPVIDWELEAKLLAQMGIHVFTIQASTTKTPAEEEDDEGSLFFKRVAEITNGLNIRLTEAPKLVDILVGICCACHGPDLLQNHRDTLRDENDGVLPPQLKDIFVSLQLHSKRRSLSTIPSLVGDLSILQKQLAKSDANGNISSSEEDEISEDEQAAEGAATADKAQEVTSPPSAQKATTKAQNKKAGANSSTNTQKAAKKVVKPATVKSAKSVKSQPNKATKVAGKTVKNAKISGNEKTTAKNAAKGKAKTEKTPVLNDKNAAGSKSGKQGLKSKNAKQKKTITKQVPAKNNKNVKAANRRTVVKNASGKSNRAVPKPAAAQKKDKTVKNQASNNSIGPGTENPPPAKVAESAKINSISSEDDAENNSEEAAGKELSNTVLSDEEQQLVAE